MKKAATTKSPRGVLAPYESEIMQRVRAHQRMVQIHAWLRDEHQVKVAYQSLCRYIARRRERRTGIDSAEVIDLFLQLSKTQQKNVFRTLSRLMRPGTEIDDREASPNTRPAEVHSSDSMEDLLAPRPDDSPAVAALKRLANMDSADLYKEL